MIARCLHITGASGSGTTTLARAFSRRHGHLAVDTDDAFWQPTTPPYQHPRPAAERLAVLESTLASCERWVLSGSLCGWGDPLIPRFDAVVFLWVPQSVRLHRLMQREVARYGAAIAPGGVMHQRSQAFLHWAAAYDSGGLDMRSRALHETWLAKLPCPVLRLESPETTQEQLDALEAWLEQTTWKH